MPSHYKPKSSPSREKISQEIITPPAPVKIEAGKITLPLNKKIYDNSAYDLINRNFSELIKSEKKINLEKLFEIYHDIFYSIPKSGNLSHENIIKQSEEYLYNFINPKDSIIEKLLIELEIRENKLNILLTPSFTVSLFSEGTFLKQEGSNNLYIIQGGTKRLLGNSEHTNTAKSVFGKRNIPLDELAQIVDPETLNGIPSGPNINTSQDFSIPLKQFDEPEEQTTTELTDLVDEYTFYLSTTQGSVNVTYKGLSPVGFYPESDTTTTIISQFENNPATISVLKPTSPTGKPFISIQNNTDDPLNDVLAITNSDTGQNVLATNITEFTEDIPFIPMHLEYRNSGNALGLSNPNKYAGYFGGKRVETRLITPSSPHAPINADIQTIFNNPIGDYYKWEMSVGGKGGISQPNSSYPRFRDNRYNQLYRWERVYGRPIYNFTINGEDIKWYWTLLKTIHVNITGNDGSVTQTKFAYYLELSTPNFNYINNTVKYEIMGNGEYKFEGVKGVHSRRLIEIRQNDFTTNVRRPDITHYPWSLINYAGYQAKYANASAQDKLKFIQPKEVYPGFEASPYQDARVAFGGPHDFL